MMIKAPMLSTIKVNNVELIEKCFSVGQPMYWIKRSGFYNPMDEIINIEDKPCVTFSAVIGNDGYVYKIENGAGAVEYRKDFTSAVLVANEMAAAK
jgi:hypothetical protein